MKPQERQRLALGHVRALQQEWRIKDLARMMKVSELTMRRDLDALERAGRVVRTTGGCIASGQVYNADYQARVARNFELKQAIGRRAAGEVRPGMSILLNDGSTTFHLASCLGDCGRITVYTNSIAMVGELSRFPDVRLHLIGGEYRREDFCLGGSLLQRMIELIQVDLVFLGTDAIDPQGNCLVQDHDMARTAELMLRRGRRKVLLADATKIGAPSSVTYAILKDFDLWITAGRKPMSITPAMRRQTTVQEVKT
jgi:DeoR family transcriptional regulator, fructose operon transcriptional repressor